MTGVGWFMTIVLGGLAGWLASKIMKADTGLISNIIVGILGAVVLNAVIGAFDAIPPEGWLAQSVIAVVGACLLIWLYRVIRGRA